MQGDYGGGTTVAEQPGDLGHVWNRVIADLSGSSPQSGVATLSSQQRAFLRLTRPLGLIDGTALLAAPSEFAKDAIERILRLPISEALGRHLGVAVTLAVVVDASAASGGSEVPDPIGNGAAPTNGSAPAGVGPGPQERSPDLLDTDRPDQTWRVPGRDELRRPGTGPLEIVDSDGATGRTALDGRDPAVRASYATPATGPRSHDPAEREVHLRHVRDRRLQPLQPRRRGGRGRGSGPRVQPAVHLG